MIKVSVMYPNTPGARFDHTYYRDKHMPMVKRLMGDSCKFYTVDKGLAGRYAGRAGHLHRHGPSHLRIGGGFPGRVRAACKGDHGRHPELHRSDTCGADQ